ncbi:GPI-anchored surface protein, putative, partial [Bodo saltans]
DVVNGIGFAQLAFQILNSCFRVWTVFVDIFIINSEIPLVLLWSTHSSSNTLQAPTAAAPPLDLDEIVDVVEVSHYVPHSPNTSADDGFLCLPNWETDDARELQVTEPRSFDDALSGLLPPLPSALHLAPPSTPPPSSQHLDFSFLNSLNHTSRVTRRIGDTVHLATDLEVGLSQVAAWNASAAEALF